MSFLLMIVEKRGARAANSPERARELYDSMMAYADALQREGVLLAAQSLRVDDHAVRISAADGALQLRDGPFAEAKEMVGGFFWLNVADRDAAIAIAHRCPAVHWATVEVRECAPCNAD
ncbi:YciI family protein [Niveibacterium sp.]|uniref:YciI family protein n=1 Tax=Niveibacterium sp. TaxID=2017444 RepID=UPI0035B28EC4